jgi:hypothetical protein
MNVFQTHSRIVSDYATYIRSFLNIADPKIRAVVEGELEQGKLWPEPLLQFNPSFEKGGSLDDLANDGTLHPDTIPHDDRVNQQAKVENLSRELMQDYLQQVGSDLVKQAPNLSLVELGRQMGVVGGPEEAPFPSTSA